MEETERTTTAEVIDSDVMFVSEPMQVISSRRNTLPSLPPEDQAKISRILHASNIDDRTKFFMLAKLRQEMLIEQQQTHDLYTDGESLQKPSINKKFKKKT